MQGSGGGVGLQQSQLSGSADTLKHACVDHATVVNRCLGEEALASELPSVEVLWKCLSLPAKRLCCTRTHPPHAWPSSRTERSRPRRAGAGGPWLHVLLPKHL